jgi:hypothetical protein
MRAVWPPPSSSTTLPKMAVTPLRATPLLPHQPPVPAQRLLPRRPVILPRPQRPPRILLPQRPQPPFKQMMISLPAKPRSSSNPLVPSTLARVPRPFPSDQSSHLSLEQSCSWWAFRGVGSFFFSWDCGFNIPSLHLLSTIFGSFLSFGIFWRSCFRRVELFFFLVSLGGVHLDAARLRCLRPPAYFLDPIFRWENLMDYLF